MGDEYYLQEGEGELSIDEVIEVESNRKDQPITESDWISDHQDQLHNMYSYIMNLNKQTGYMIFDHCTFHEFCVLAYERSSVYEYRDRYFRS